MDYRKLYEEKKGTLADCLELVRNGDLIVTGGAAEETPGFISGLETIIDRIENVTLQKGRDFFHPFLYDEKIRGHLFTVCHLYNGDLRKAQKLGLSSHLPSDLSTFGRIRGKEAPPDIFVVQTTDMDEEGNFCVPYSMMFEQEMFEVADRIVLEVNPRFKKVRGGLMIPIERVDRFFIDEKDPFTIPCQEPGEADKKIGEYIAEFINDGDTVQIGIGRLPDAVAVLLEDKKDLGLHTEMFTSNMVSLIRKGVITGERKTLDRGEHIGAFGVGDLEMFETLSANEKCRVAPCAYTNDPYIISQQDNMKSVNTCIEIDLTGQVSSESIGYEQFSGTGGAGDFARGALMSKGGRGIIALNATAKNDTVSKIKATLTPGAIVTIQRNLVDTVVTEYGVAFLKGKSVGERVRALINIAHPNFRKDLEKEARSMFLI